MDHEAFMRRAIELSKEKMQGGAGGPFGAVIVKDGEIISEGWNQVTSTNDPTAHAEIVAVRNACKKLNNFELHGCTVYTSCEPCPMCLSAIFWSRCANIFYANTRDDAAAIQFDDQKLYRELTLPFHRRKIPMTQISREEALVAFKMWQEKDDKIRY